MDSNQIYNNQNTQTYNQNNQVNNLVNNIPEEYRPLGMWAYFGYQLLFAIPCVGFILLLVFSFGGTKNLNLRNFARSYFCFLILIVAILAIILLIGGLGVAGMMASYN